MVFYKVSSFETVAKDSEGKETALSSQIPKKCDKNDLLRWRNSMHRDFTINRSIFYYYFFVCVRARNGPWYVHVSCILYETYL